MKKFFAKITLCVAALTMGVGITSCDNDVIQNIIDLIIGGKSYTYNGTYTMQLYGLNTLSGKLAPMTEVATYENTKVEATAGASVAGTVSSVKITVPGTEFAQGVKMSDVTLSGLTIDNNGNLGTGQSTRGNGTLTLNGTSMNLYDVDITAKLTTDDLKITQLVVFFGDTGDYAVEITYLNGRIFSNN